ncbi:Discoidin domain-containing protein OS=Streptomyces tendae OX=1932 GN=GUR47_05720 PE=4 SV=1 [Streptomyces tendae]
MDLNWEAAYAKEFRIEASSDGQNWQTLKSVTGATGGKASYDVSGSGRYVRVHGTARATGYGYSLWEVAVHTGTTGDSPGRGRR